MTTLFRALIFITLLWNLVLPAPADEPVAVRLVPEWELNGPVVLVWPEHLRRHRDQGELITALIQALPAEREVAVISPRPPSMRALQELGRDVRYIAMDRVRDVHIRDWAALPAADTTGRLFAVKFHYQPGHLTRGDVAQAYDNHHVGQQLGERLYGAVREIPLVMSGSAITHNGKGAAIISQRVISENEQFSLQTIRDMLREHAGITRLVFAPVLPGDKEGHLTGLIRFASDRVVLITAYPPDDTGRSEFADRLAEQVRRELGRGFRVVRVPFAAMDGRPNEGGSYLDYIALNNLVLFPTYGQAEDTQAIRILKEALPDRHIIPMNAEPLLSVMRAGNAPHRLSAVY